MSLAINDLLSRAESHALTLARFERVNGHEPKNPPGHGLTAALWVQRITPVPAASGLASTSVRLELGVRLYIPADTQDPDTIDPHLTEATDALMDAYSGDFSLGGAVQQVDLLGAYGDPMDAQAGYLEQDSTVFRVMTIQLPLIVSDLWTQEA
ncbi:hypothetical protein [Streptomyces boncukensis]|uniref:Uncharacterized protein n=1 Tax=Streptomyces boncukensis TaxID=2711219 RepID=A0A6G4WTT0_9ACTN|nr:hypothetical protein [Streptomyces boncukensis]NGO68518.1 hypothetical protein [Streptomyces boncukensis]